MPEFIQTLLIALIPAFITALSSYFLAKRNFKSEILKMKETQKNELEQIMMKNEIDIEALKQKHNNEIDIINLKHKHELELKEKELDNLIKQQENQNQAQMVNNVFGSFLNGALNNSEVSDLIGKYVVDAMKKNKKDA